MQHPHLGFFNRINGLKFLLVYIGYLVTVCYLLLWNSVTQGVVRILSWSNLAKLVPFCSTKIHYKNPSFSWLIENDLISFFKILLLLIPVNSQPTIFSILATLWYCNRNCVHMFRLIFVDNLCQCNLPKYNTWLTCLWSGDPVIVFIQRSWLLDQGLRSQAWNVFYYDCISLILSEARMYCLMYLVMYMLLSFFLMVSEHPGCDNPCGVSKAQTLNYLLLCVAWENHKIVSDYLQNFS